MGKSEFPAAWSDDEIMHHVSDVATDPGLQWVRQPNGRIRIEGTRKGIDMTVILNRNEIWTAYPR